MSARADLCGGRSAMVVPTATSFIEAFDHKSTVVIGAPWLAFSYQKAPDGQCQGVTTSFIGPGAEFISFR
jgi:hypothetical protein